MIVLRNKTYAKITAENINGATKAAQQFATTLKNYRGLANQAKSTMGVANLPKAARVVTH